MKSDSRSPVLYKRDNDNLLRNLAAWLKRSRRPVESMKPQRVQVPVSYMHGAKSKHIHVHIDTLAQVYTIKLHGPLEK